MKKRNNKYGLTLTELLVVIAVMAILVGIGVTATKAVLESFESSTNVKRVISAALSNARAIAAKEQKYAGVRFQQDANGNHYMIFIIKDLPAPAAGFRAVPGKKPIRLPSDVGVMDLRVKGDYDNPLGTDTETVSSNDYINDDVELLDTSTFSVVFSPTGKLVNTQVRAINRDGVIDDSSTDDVFNTATNISNGVGMFLQDEYNDDAVSQEYSRTSFIIYEKKEFAKVAADDRWDGFLTNIDACYLSPYTGQIVIEQ